MSVKATHPDERRAKKKGRVMWGFLYLFAFLAAFGGSAVWKLKHDPFGGEFQVSWNDSVGRVYKDLAYGQGKANRFDLYVPADNSKSSYGLIVYLHAGGFTGGDKSGDAGILTWLCSDAPESCKGVPSIYQWKICFRRAAGLWKAVTGVAQTKKLGDVL